MSPDAAKPLPQDVFAVVAGAVQDAVVAADQDGRIVLWTGGAEAIFGYTEAEAVGMPLENIVPPSLRDKHREGFGRVAAGGPPSLMGTGSLSLEACRAGGETFPVELTLGRVVRPEGMLFVGIIRDDTERRRVLDELASSLNDHEQFASVASHDLSEPLRLVDGYLKLLARRHGERLPEEAAAIVRECLSATSRMRALIDALLRYAQAGNAPAEVEELDSSEVTAQAVDALGTMLAEHGVAVHIGALPPVCADEILLRQALQNLLGNAVRHARSQVRVEGTVEPDRTVRLSVGDDGPGIPADKRARALDPFVRGDAGGMAGLGLAIVRRSMERHGGRVEIGESALGGAEITLVLPAPG